MLSARGITPEGQSRSLTWSGQGPMGEDCVVSATMCWYLRSKNEMMARRAWRRNAASCERAVKTASEQGASPVIVLVAKEEAYLCWNVSAYPQEPVYPSRLGMKVNSSRQRAEATVSYVLEHLPLTRAFRGDCFCLGHDSSTGMETTQVVSIGNGPQRGR